MFFSSCPTSPSHPAPAQGGHVARRREDVVLHPESSLGAVDESDELDKLDELDEPDNPDNPDNPDEPDKHAPFLRRLTAWPRTGRR